MTEQKSVVADLCDRMHVLRLRYLVVFARLTVDNPPYIPLAESLAKGLMDGDRGAITITRSLIDPSETDRADFWGTPLGRLLFAAGGGGETVTQTIAASLLGCSRQWINKMMATGKLDATYAARIAHREVYADQVRALLQAKVDKEVK